MNLLRDFFDLGHCVGVWYIRNLVSHTSKKELLGHCALSKPFAYGNDLYVCSTESRELYDDKPIKMYIC